MIRVLHLGCGQSKAEGALGVDINPHSEADVICNLDSFPYPFAGNSFTVILCEHILEHLTHVIEAMEEIHRIGVPGGRVIIDVPHYSSTFYYRDPTHKHPFSVHSFDYFFEGTSVRKFHYTDVTFRLVSVGFPPPDGAGFLKRMIYRLINQHLEIYERYFAFIFPRHLLRFELEVVK